MIGSILLMVSGGLLLLGLGRKAIKDFGVPSLVLVLLCAVVVGLNFIPPIRLPKVSFSVGTAVLWGVCLFFAWVKGKRKNRFLCLFVTVLLSAFLYGSILFIGIFGRSGTVGYGHAFVIGFLSFLATKNAKYAFLSAFFSLSIVVILCQGSGTIQLDTSYSLSLVAGIFSVTLYSISSFLVSKHAKLVPYMEVGRLAD